MKWYGSITNRIEENRQLVPTITVGTGMTKYSWSDTHAYEVIAVKDQKHVTVREYDHKLKGEAYSNDWELISNPENHPVELSKRGKYWYETSTYTDEDGKTHRSYNRWNVTFGKAEYYYDYSF